MVCFMFSCTSGVVGQSDLASLCLASGLTHSSSAASFVSRSGSLVHTAPPEPRELSQFRIFKLDGGNTGLKLRCLGKIHLSDHCGYKNNRPLTCPATFSSLAQFFRFFISILFHMYWLSSILWKPVSRVNA